MMNPPVLEQSTEPTPDQWKVNGNCLSAGGPIRLNLGGAGEGYVDSRVPGFLCVDLRDVDGVDIVADCSHLSMFSGDSVDTIFASQVLEHFPIAKIIDVLKEWKRVLKPGGKLYVSVPDFDVAVKLYHHVGLTLWLKYHLWGDQKHPLNYHYVCFTGASLMKDLMDAGFSDVKRITKFPFEVKGGAMNRDNTLGLLLSVNMEATK